MSTTYIYIYRYTYTHNACTYTYIHIYIYIYIHVHVYGDMFIPIKLLLAGQSFRYTPVGGREATRVLVLKLRGLGFGL